MKRVTTSRIAGAGILALILSSGLSACGSDDDDGAASSGLPARVTIKALSDLTGATAFLGKQAENGMRIALEEINGQKFLGDTRLEIETTDLGSNQQTSASEAAKAAADKSVPLVIANTVTPIAAAAAPIMQRQGVPFISSLSGVLGVNLGEYTYILPTPVQSMQKLAAGYLKSKGTTKLGILYDSSNATQQDIAEKIYPGLADEYGLTIVETIAVNNNTVDLSAPINKLLGAGADAIFLGVAGAQAATAVQQAGEHGFTGNFVATAGVAGGVLKPAGKYAIGVTWSNDFSAVSTAERSKSFTEVYKSKYNGEAPIQGAAYGYDAVWLAARAIKQANSVNRGDVLKGLQEVTSGTIDNSPRGGVTFKDRVSYSTGLLVQWDGTKEVAVPQP
ncbi:ABC transporter substrate-binding protein [Dactylosporangium sp. NPDC005572]|uniref:ABC transporter substrate-binding protein n=1 Tax=Dactylosporangium sp. NPDC005572 TaxID=3156889 RepID=UPI0033ACBCBC